MIPRYQDTKTKDTKIKKQKIPKKRQKIKRWKDVYCPHWQFGHMSGITLCMVKKPGFSPDDLVNLFHFRISGHFKQLLWQGHLNLTWFYFMSSLMKLKHRRVTDIFDMQ